MLFFEQEVAESTEEWAFISAASVPSCWAFRSLVSQVEAQAVF